MFNVTFFIILKAYAGMATDDEASCWAKCSSVRFFPFVFYLNSPNKRTCQIVCDLCQGFAGYAEASSSNDAGLRHACICKAPRCFMSLFFRARFQHENAKLFGNLLPRRAIIQRSHIELSSARMFDAASIVEHMPHSVLVRLFAR